MPGALPEGGPAPDDGLLPAGVRVGARERRFGVYLHVPFCAVRCGYCDFTTYTAEELGGGADRAAYPSTAALEIALAERILTAAGLPGRPAGTVFLGGGTPTVLPSAALASMLDAVRRTWGLEPGAEVSVEANPDSVTPGSLAELAEAGVTRISFGMQSAVPHVLATLDRTHAPDRVPTAVRWARAAGLGVSLDLIYGTPGESVQDWRRSLEAALACEPDHVSAYALVVEVGTRLAAAVGRGQLPAPDEDDLADKYEVADETLGSAGYQWYEVSNWARRRRDRCRHNLGYWRGDDWWGIGPGAHSHVGGVRWWNVRHPTPYTQRLRAGLSPAAGREELDAAQRHAERVLLGVRTSDGLPAAALGAGAARLAALVGDGLVLPDAGAAGRLVLTRRGRLMADTVVRAVLP